MGVDTGLSGIFSAIASRPRFFDVAPPKNPTIWTKYSEPTTLQLGSRTEQVEFLTQNVPGLTATHADAILEAAFSRGSSAVFGGSRVRGDSTPSSDIDVGWGSLSTRQAQRVIDNLNKQGFDLRLEATPIVPGYSSRSIETITTPELFFQRSGIRSASDPRAGEPYGPSGSITVTKDGKVILVPPGK
jgi:hypothetical protein